MRNNKRAVRKFTILAAAAVASWATTASAATLTWDSSGATPATPTDGSGTWNSTDPKWSDGVSDIAWDNVSTAAFGSNNGAAGTVTIDDVSGTVTAAGLTFNPPGSGSYTIAAAAGNTLTLSGANPIISLAPAATSATISAPITGAFGTLAGTTVAGLGIAGGGTLNLTGVNTGYTGDLYIRDNSVVNLNGAASLGNASGRIFVGLIATGQTTTDTSVLNMNGTSSLTASTLFIDYNQAAITVSTTAGSTLNVNGTNTINADSIIIDAGRNNGNTKGGFGSLRLGSGAVLTLNGAAGAGNNVNVLDIANYVYESGGSTTTGIVGLADFSAGTVNGTINTIHIATGKAGSSGTTGVSDGTMRFNNGSLTAGVINIARTGRQPALGNLTVGAGTGTLTAGAITFGAQAFTGASTSTGTMNLNGGTVVMTGNITANPNGTSNTINATINLAGGTLDMGGFSIVPNSVNGNPITLNASSGTLKNVAGINNGAGLTKNSSGTLELAGNNTYTGDTTVNLGTVFVTGALSGGGNVIINNTASLIGTGDGATTGLAGNVVVNGGNVRPGTVAGDTNGRITTSSLTLNSGSLSIDVGPSLATDLIQSTGNLTLGADASSLLTLNVGGSPSAGSYEIIDYAGTLTKNADFAINGPLGFDFALDYATAGKVFLNVTAGELLTWTGAADQTTWNFSAVNFNNGTSNVAYSDPKPVRFDDSAPAGATNINIATTVSPSAVAVNSSTHNYTFGGSGAIGGTASLTKSGTSTLTITNSNTYSGTTTINGGTIQVGNGGTTGSLGSGAVNIDAAGTLAYNRSDTVTVANTIAGGGGLRQIGTGTLVLTGNNNYDSTTISSGTVQVGDGGTSGTLGAGAVINSGTLAFNRSDNVNFAKVISGTGGVSSLAPSVLTLSAANTFTGPVNIATDSTIKVTASNSVGATTGTPGNVNVAAGATLDVGVPVAGSINFGQRVIHIQGNGVGDVGAVRNSATTTQLNLFNYLTLDGDAMIAGSRMDLGRTVTNGILNLQNHTLTANMSGSNPIFSVLDEATVTAGSIVVNTGGLNFERDVKVPNSGGTITYNTGTVAQFFETSANSVNRDMVFKGSNTIGAGSTTIATVNSNMQLQGDVTLQALASGVAGNGNNPLRLAGNISDSGGSFGITKVGTNTVTLAGDNTYHGATNINAGTLVVTKSHTAGSSFSVASGATAQLATSTATPNNVVLKTAALSPAGRLDLRDNKVVVSGGNVGTSDGATYSGLSGLVQQAFNAGTWDQPGITTTMTDALSGLTSIGVADADTVGYAGGTFGGAAVNSGDVLLMYTYCGDANLDGFISADDYSAIDFAVGVPGAYGWSNGDFNWDGFISADDYSAIDFNLVAQQAPINVAAPEMAGRVGDGVVAVPEPACGVALLLLGASTTFTRRRRHRHRAHGA